MFNIEKQVAAQSNAIKLIWLLGGLHYVVVFTRHLIIH